MATVTNPTPLTPTSIAGNADRNLLSVLDILTPHYYPKLVSQFGAEQFTVILEMMGMSKKVEGKEFFHFERRNRLHAKVKVEAAVDTTMIANGGAVTFELTDDSHFDSGTKSPIRVGEIVEIAGNKRQGVVVAVNKSSANAHTATVRPLKSTQKFESAANTLAANTEILFRGMYGVGEASDKGDALQPLVKRVTGLVSEIREDWNITDRALMEKIYYSEGGGQFYRYHGEQDAAKRFMNNKEFALIFGVTATNTAVAGVNDTTKGLIETVETDGISVTGATWTDVSIFDDITDGLDKENGATEYCWLQDTKQYTDAQNAIRDTYNQGGIQYGFFKGDKEIAVAQGFRSLHIHGRTFHFKKYMPFNAGAVYGINSSYYDNFGLMVPIDVQADASTGESVYSIAIRYQEPKAGQRYQIWETGGLADSNKTTKAELNVSYLCYDGLEVFGANRFAIVRN